MAGRGSQRPEWLTTAKGLAVLAQLGIQIVVPIVAGVLLGAYLERRSGQILWFLFITVLGVVAGLWNGFRLILGLFTELQDK